MVKKISIPKPSSKGTPPTADATSPVVGNNTNKPEAGELVPLNFRVPAEIRREVRAFKVEHDIDMVDIFLDAWAEYKKIKGKG